MRTIEIDIRTKTWTDVLDATSGKCIKALSYLTTFALAGELDKHSYAHIAVPPATTNWPPSISRPEVITTACY